MRELQKFLSPFLAVIFTLSTLFPVHTAIAYSDCGEHELVLCKTHNDEHLVARHVSDQIAVDKSATHNHVKSGTDENSDTKTSHDRTHQIEKSKSPALNFLEKSFESFKCFYTHESQIFSLNTSVFSQDSHQYFYPLIVDYFLTILSSIRLQI